MTNSSSFSSILSKYKSASSQPSSANASVISTTSADAAPLPRPQTTALKTGSAPPTNKVRPTPAASTPTFPPKQLSKSTVSTNAPTSKSRNSDAPNDQAPKRRKLDAPAKVGPLTAAEKDMEERRKALMEKVRAKKEAAVPKPTSYKEMLAKAAQIQAEKKNMVGVITHKPRPPQEKKLKTESKTIKGATALPNRNSKSPGVGAAGEKGSKKGADAGKTGPTKRIGDVTRPTTSKDATLDRKKSVDSPVLKRKRDPPVAKMPQRKPTIPERRRNKYDDDDEDDWIVDDEEDDPRGRSYGGYGGYGRSRYTYAEDYDDDESDMEATGLDLLEEEERSRLAAIKEDQMEAKRLEEEAKRKAALKKAAMKKK